MTCALVTPAPGNSTFSRLETLSVRPSISTRCFAGLTARSRAGGAGRSQSHSRRSRLDHHVVRLEVVPDPAPGGVAEPVVGGPHRVGDLADQVRLDPVRVPGHLARQGTLERRVLPGGEHPLEIAQVPIAEAGADVPDVDQPTLVVRDADEQRA